MGEMPSGSQFFNQMTYREKYNELIEYRKKFQPPTTAYTEKHHILPKSCGGTNDPDNIVRLTGAEHFKAHYYLAKAMKEENDPNYRKMVLAFTQMKRLLTKNSALTDSQLEEFGKLYESLREEFKFGNLGRKRNTAQKKNISEKTKDAMKNVPKDSISPWKGKHSPALGRIWITNGTDIRRITEEDTVPDGWVYGLPDNYGKKHTEETKRKLSVAGSGKHWYNNGKTCVRARECPEGFVLGRIYHRKSKRA